MPRRTPVQREAEWRALDARVLPELLERIAGVGTWEEAQELARSAPASDAPGRRHYANLGFLLTHLAVPGGATQQELRAYIGMVERINRTGHFGCGLGDKLLEQLREALATRQGGGPWACIE